MTEARLTAIIKAWLRENSLGICTYGLIPKSWEFEKDLAAHILSQVGSQENIPHDFEGK